MRRYNTLFMIMACLVAAPNVAAQQPLTLEECRSMALQNNKQIAVAAQQQEKAAYVVKAYRANFLPKLSATGNYLLTTASLEREIPSFYLPTYVPDGSGQLVPNILTSVDGVPIFKEYAFFPGMELNLRLNGTYLTGLRLEQPIYMGGKITSAYRMAQLGEEMARLNRQKSEAEVILQADEAYWSYVRVLELKKVAESYKEMLARLATEVENAYKEGMVPRNDLLRVEVKQNEVELQLLKADNGVRLARMNLCHVVGLPLNSEVTAVERPGVFQDEALPLPDLSSRPEVKLLMRQVDLKDQQVKLVRSEFLPQVGIGGNFAYANGLKLNDSKLLDHAAFSAVVSVQVPIFHWGEGKNRVRSAMAEKRVAQLQQEELTGKMELEVQQALQAYQESVAAVELTNRSLSQAEENLRESRDRYDAGMETLSNLLEAQAMWQKAKAELVEAGCNAQLATTRYLKAAGKL
jgi:outer membrane protein TolC